MIEEWKVIEGFSKYEISNLGRLKSLKYKGANTEKILDPWLEIRKGKSLYYRTSIVDDSGKVKGKFIHRLVAETFIQNQQNYKEVNHIDGNKLNNSVSNLEWCTRRQNQHHALINDLMPSKIKYSIRKKVIKDVESGMSVSIILKKYSITVSDFNYIFNKQYGSHNRRLIIRNDGVLFNSLEKAGHSIGSSKQAIDYAIKNNNGNCMGFRFMPIELNHQKVK